VKRFDYPQLAKLRSAVLRTALIGKLSLEWPQAPFLWASAVIFPGGKRRHFAYTFQFADDAMKTDVYKALYLFYTKKRKGTNLPPNKLNKEIKPPFCLYFGMQ